MFICVGIVLLPNPFFLSPFSSLSLSSPLTVLTKEDGSYRLENMTTGTYTLRTHKDLMFFEPITVKIAPNTPQLPDIITAG
jgi:hypothetical protein